MGRSESNLGPLQGDVLEAWDAATVPAIQQAGGQEQRRPSNDYGSDAGRRRSDSCTKSAFHADHGNFVGGRRCRQPLIERRQR